MGSFAARGSRFIYTDDKGDKIILDLNDFMMNKSRIPFHTVTGDKTVSDIVVYLMDTHSIVSEGTDEHRYLVQYTLLDTLIMRCAIQTSKSIKAVELGAGNGILSYHLGVILGTLNSNSELTCVCDTIGNGSESRWVDSICQIRESEQPKVRFMASDYNSTMLSGHSFDIVVINATEEIDDIKGTVEEARRLVKPSGEIFCICHRNNWLLYDLFAYLMSGYESYSIGESGFVLTGNGNRNGQVL